MIETKESRAAWQKEHEEAKAKLRNVKLPSAQPASPLEPQIKPERKAKKGYTKK